MRRDEFLWAGSLAVLRLSSPQYAASSAQDDTTDDPATSARQQALRVLLGSGRAEPLDAESFSFGGRRYRGTFSTTDDGRVVNLVPLEQYLYSVVPREMPHSWPAAALQAQAVVARTYVLQRSSPVREYDLIPSEADQVYTGVDAEHSETSAAVDQTAGQVLRFGNGFAQVMYSSCCGGHTESNADAWGGKLLEYLAGVTCTYCTDSPWFSWTKDVPLEQFESALSQQLSAAGQVQSVELLQPDRSGRTRVWRFHGSSGYADVNAKDVRRLIGTRTLPSLLVRKIDAAGGGPGAPFALAIQGAGLGHGVGLCQWGARGMALSGSTARAILAFYYPGTGAAND